MDHHVAPVKGLCAAVTCGLILMGCEAAGDSTASPPSEGEPGESSGTEGATEQDPDGEEPEVGEEPVLPPPYDGPGVFDPSPYADEVLSFSPGSYAGYGQDDLPDVALGPPHGKGHGAASSDVVSLGVGGEIIVGFSGRQVLDGPGPDLVIFENPFWVGMNPTTPWAELGEVSVSADGETWHTFPCDIQEAGPGQWPGCAGWQPTLDYDVTLAVPLWPPMVGGDPFDLADLGLDAIQYVRIRDLSEEGVSPSAGFDLDAVGVVHISD